MLSLTEPKVREEVGTLKALGSQYAETVGWWIAALGVCESQATGAACEGVSGEVLAACTGAAESLQQEPEGCDSMQMDRDDPTGVPLDQLPPMQEPLPAPPEHNPAQPPPGAGNAGTGVAAPDPRTHGHVPDGTPGGGHHPPPSR